MKKNLLKITLSIVTFFSSVLMAYAAPADTIIITEVEYNPSGPEAEGEWFELFNPTNTSIDISGWTIEEDGGPFFTFPITTTINSGDFLLVVNDTTGFNVEHPGVIPDIDMSGPGCFTDTDCLRLNNSGSDSLTLRDGDIGTGTTIAQIIWGTGGFASAGNGESICRNTSEDTNTAADWDSDCIPSPKSGTYDIQDPTPTSSSSNNGGKSGSIRWICGNPLADNYTNTRFGRHRDSQCIFSKKENIITDVNTPNCVINYSRLIKQGVVGEDVQQLQICMNSLGYTSGPEDGIYGPMTYRGVTSYQRDMNLRYIDGIVGPETSSSLNARTNTVVN